MPFVTAGLKDELQRLTQSTALHSPHVNFQRPRKVLQLHLKSKRQTSLPFLFSGWFFCVSVCVVFSLMDVAISFLPHPNTHRAASLVGERMTGKEPLLGSPELELNRTPRTFCWGWAHCKSQTYTGKGKKEGFVLKKVIVATNPEYSTGITVCTYKNCSHMSLTCLIKSWAKNKARKQRFPKALPLHPFLCCKTDIFPCQVRFAGELCLI